VVLWQNLYTANRNTEFGDKVPKKWTVIINDKLDTDFRKAVFEDKGMRKGNLTEALEEAMNCWIKQKTEKKK
jgi:hypothetical protein